MTEAGETNDGIDTEDNTLGKRFQLITKADQNYLNEFQRPKIQKVTFLRRDDKNFKMYYEPRLLSLGPIHHGKSKYQLGEKLKLVLTSKFIKYSGQIMKEVYKTIEENINELRECFEEEVTKAYDDEALAWLLFVDGCAVIQYIYCVVQNQFNQLKIKPDTVTFGQQDLFLLENQLPYRLLQWLMSLSRMKKELWESIETYIAKHGMVGDSVCSKEKLEEQIISMDAEPIHLLDHLRTKLLGKAQLDSLPIPNIKTSQDWQSYRNVQELKAAGIHLKPGSSSCLRNISFAGRFVSPGYLYLPPIIVDESTRPKFLNLIAYEMCPDFANDFGITSYISFLDSLISEANDVKELRKAGILLNFLGNDEEVAQLFNELGTELAPNPYIYVNVKSQIQGHYDTLLSWMFRFYYDHFGGTWSIAGFLGVMLGLVLSGIQAWFTVNPASQRPAG